MLSGAHHKENPAAGIAAGPGAVKAAGGLAHAASGCEAPGSVPSAATAAAARRAALGQLGLNQFRARREPGTEGCRADAAPLHAATTRPPTTVEPAAAAGDGSGVDDDEDGEIEAFFPNPHAAVHGDAALLGDIAAAEATLAASSGATAAERAAAEHALWERCDLPWVDVEALGRAHAVSRVCAFLDAFGGGAPPLEEG